MSRKPGYPLHRLIKERRAALGLSRTDVPRRMGLPQRQQGRAAGAIDVVNR